MRISPMTAPAASSSAKEGIFGSAAGSCALTGPSEQAKATQQPASKRDGEAARRRKIRERRIGGARRAIPAVTRPIVRGKKRLRQISGSCRSSRLITKGPGRNAWRRAVAKEKLDRRDARAYHGRAAGYGLTGPARRRTREVSWKRFPRQT